MTEQKYIGIENELISFRGKKTVPFNYTNFKKICSETKRFLGSCSTLWSDTGNLYYLDCDEIEIATPPIALNKGFATRVISLLIDGRNNIIKSTPHMKHTGYSIHWNLTASENINSF